MTTTSYVSGVRGQANIPNCITAVRAIAFVPVVLCLYLNQSVLAFFFVVVAGASDGIDGYAARKFNSLTPLGRIGDPLADKLFINFTLLPLVFLHQSPPLAILWVVVIAYDAHNTWRRRFEIGRAILNVPDDLPDLPVNWVSKSKTVVLFMLVAYGCLPSEYVDPDWFFTLTASALVLVVWAWYRHFAWRKS